MKNCTGWERMGRSKQRSQTGSTAICEERGLKALHDKALKEIKKE